MDLNEPVQQDQIFLSSSLAIAMEHLELLDEEYAKYAATRGGLLSPYFLYVEEGKQDVEVFQLTTREILELLPEV